MSPQLSVVIASINSQAYLAKCLSALRQQIGMIDAEVIVADCVGADVTEFIRTEYPDVELLSFQDAQTVPTLRAAALLVAQGDIIAITEDHCIPPPNWYESICQAHATCDALAIGGSVDNGAVNTVIDWAVFFCEYSRFISPVPHGVVHDLPAPNVSYKRSSLLALQEQFKTGYRETSIHAALESQGHHLWSDPSLSMIHKKHFTLQAFLTERFHYSRAFAGQRTASLHWRHRLFYLIFSPLLPILLLKRLIVQALPHKAYLKQFCLSFPYLLLFTVVWAIGEWIGYAIGAGDSERYLA